jgi:hypothetical protein
MECCLSAMPMLLWFASSILFYNLPLLCHLSLEFYLQKGKEGFMDL